MKDLWNKFQAWNEKRRQIAMEKWAKTRKKGDTRYIVFNTLLMFLILAGSRIVVRYFFADIVFSRETKIHIFLSFFGSFFIAWWSWSASERKYQKYLKTQADAKAHEQWKSEFMVKS